jgi:hypothetical protein
MKYFLKTFFNNFNELRQFYTRKRLASFLKSVSKIILFELIKKCALFLLFTIFHNLKKNNKFLKIHRKK